MEKLSSVRGQIKFPAFGMIDLLDIPAELLKRDVKSTWNPLSGANSPTNSQLNLNCYFPLAVTPTGKRLTPLPVASMS